MDFLLSAVKTLSAVSVITAVFLLIMPEGRCHSTFKYSVGIFFLSALIGLFVNLPHRLPQKSLTTDLNLLNEASQKISLCNIELAIKGLLTNNNVKCEKVTAFTDISEKGDINITKVSLRLEGEQELARARAIIKEQTGLLAVGE